MTELEDDQAEWPELPIVDATPDIRAGQRVLLVDCPYCGHHHTHSGGHRPGDGDGHRHSHCGQLHRNDGYLLRERR